MADKPQVFGADAVTVVTGETTHTFTFGTLEAGLAYIQPRDGSAPIGVPWWVGKQRGTAHVNDGWATTVDQAVAAIERELSAIRDALNAVCPAKVEG